MDNEDTRPMRTKDAEAEPSLATNDAFLRALHRLQAALDMLGAAIAADDAATFDAIASDAFAYLLAAISLFRRMETTEEPDPRRSGTAWYAVRTHQRALLDLFVRAKTQLASPQLHVRLEQHRISLTLALEGLGPRPAASGT